jgi:hypothetical protein
MRPRSWFVCAPLLLHANKVIRGYMCIRETLDCIGRRPLRLCRRCMDRIACWASQIGKGTSCPVARLQNPPW